MLVGHFRGAELEMSCFGRAELPYFGRESCRLGVLGVFVTV